MTTTDLVTDALAAHRLARLVTKDEITDKLRTKVKYRGPEWAGVLVECRWCAGFWLSLGIVVARTVAPRAWAPIARALALSSAAALLASIERD